MFRWHGLAIQRHFLSLCIRFRFQFPYYIIISTFGNIILDSQWHSQIMIVRDITLDDECNRKCNEVSISI